MSSSSLASALSILREAVRTHGGALHPKLHAEIGRLCLQLLGNLTQDAAESPDPRLVLQTASLVEQQYRSALRGQLQLTAAAEATGAHLLSTAEYNRLKTGDTPWQRPAERCSGRAAHLDTGAVLAAWLGLNDFETKARVQDAHRVVARRTMAGTPATARFEKLSALFLDPSADPRPARDAARRLEKFEPADQIGNGTALPPCATGPDGVLLEDHAIRLLQQHDRVTASKRLGELCTAYREANTEQIPPQEYFRKLRSVMGVDFYAMAVAGGNAETMRSLIAQCDNPLTKLGKAARTGSAPPEASETSETSEAPAATPAARSTGTAPTTETGTITDSAPTTAADEPDNGADVPTPVWLQTSEPPPAWAVDRQDESSASPPANTPDASGSSSPAPAATPPDATQPPDPGPTPQRPPTQAMAEAPPVKSDRATAATVAPTDSELPLEQRRLNAFMALLRQRFTGTGNATQVLPVINVYMQLSQLMDLATAHGITAHGVRIGPAELRRMLCDAYVIPHVLSGEGQILDQGRAKRTFTKVQRQSLLARDRGCICPDCTYPPGLCEAHHCDEGGWAGGCPTNVAKGAMACPIHHDDYHSGKFKIVLINGLPYVLKPKYLDPTQTPQRNKYWFGDDEPIPGEAPPTPPSSAKPQPARKRLKRPKRGNPPDAAPPADTAGNAHTDAEADTGTVTGTEGTNLASPPPEDSS